MENYIYTINIKFKYIQNCLAVEELHCGFTASSQVNQPNLCNSIHTTKYTCL